MVKIKNPKLKNPIEKEFNIITRYHYFIFFVIFLSKLPVLWHILSLIFLSPPMNFHCNTNNDANINKTNTCPCDDPIWDRRVFTETVQTKFGIYCEKAWLISFSESMSFVGLLVGSLMFGFFSDKYGRLSAYSMSFLILAAAGSLVSLMPTIIPFIIMRFFEGIGAGGAVVTAYVLCVEYCGLRHRETVTALFHIPSNLGHATLVGMSYALRNCDELQLALSIPVFFFVAARWLIMESPKWLLDNGYVEEAIAVMEKFCSFNRGSPEVIRNEIEEYEKTIENKPGNKIKFYQIFKHKKLRLNLGCMAYNYFVCGMGYYGVSQFIGKMSGNIHINVAVSGVLLLPGTIASVFLLQWFGRRPLLMATNSLSGLFMLIVICFPEKFAWVRVIFACFCNSFFYVSFIIVFLYGVELFPTSVRNAVLGFLSLLSRVGQIVAPQINALSTTAAGGLFGSLAILGAILTIPLPETKNTELPSTLEDSNTLTRKSIVLEEDRGPAFIPPQTSTQ